MALGSQGFGLSRGSLSVVFVASTELALPILKVNDSPTLGVGLKPSRSFLAHEFLRSQCEHAHRFQKSKADPARSISIDGVPMSQFASTTLCVTSPITITDVGFFLESQPVIDNLLNDIG